MLTRSSNVFRFPRICYVISICPKSKAFHITLKSLFGQILKRHQGTSICKVKIPPRPTVSDKIAGLIRCQLRSGGAKKSPFLSHYRVINSITEVVIFDQVRKGQIILLILHPFFSRGRWDLRPRNRAHAILSKFRLTAKRGSKFPMFQCMDDRLLKYVMAVRSCVEISGETTGRWLGRRSFWFGQFSSRYRWDNPLHSGLGDVDVTGGRITCSMSILARGLGVKNS